MNQEEYLPISMLNQLEYCERRFYLMHVLGEMDVNVHVLEGTLRHAQAHDAGKEREGEMITHRRVPGLMAEARAALGEYLGTHADNVVYVTNVTVAVNIVELYQHLPDVPFDGIRGDAQAGGNLPIGVTETGQGSNILLTRRESLPVSPEFICRVKVIETGGKQRCSRFSSGRWLNANRHIILRQGILRTDVASG